MSECKRKHDHSKIAEVYAEWGMKKQVQEGDRIRQ